MSDEQKKLAWLFLGLVPIGVFGNLLVAAFVYRVFQLDVATSSNEFLAALHPAFVCVLLIILLPMVETAGLLVIRGLLVRKSQRAEFVDPFSRDVFIPALVFAACHAPFRSGLGCEVLVTALCFSYMLKRGEAVSRLTGYLWSLGLHAFHNAIVIVIFHLVSRQ